MNFSSDTSAPAHPLIMEAVAAANRGMAASYGADAWCEAARAAIAAVFETDVEVWLTASGTAANALALSVICPPTGAVLCHEQAHVERDERGAPEFFTGGAKLQLLSGAHGKIDPAALAGRLASDRPGSVHQVPAAALSLSNLTESGAAYSPAEMRVLTDAAKAGGLLVHLDGARFANAVAGTGASPAELTWKSGVDVLSFGATKNGALGVEAIILFGEARQRIGELRERAKRGGHMPPKMRYLGAQLTAYLADGLWLDLAAHANATAAKLAEVLVSEGAAQLAAPVDGNEIFAVLPAETLRRLQQAGALFAPWEGGVHRFVASWATRAEDVDALRACLGARRD
ncbi:threonine aldolase [bacterium]|nr:threonine aldolase [bacterium]